MAFDKDYLHCFGSDGKRRLFVYTTADTLASVYASGYFNVTTDMRYTLKNGDLVVAIAASGSSAGILTISSTTGTSPVTTTNAAFT